MKDIKRLILVGVCAVFFIGLYILSDHYAEEAVGKYSDEISQGGSRLTSRDNVTLDDLNTEAMIMGQTVSSNETILTFTGGVTFEEPQLRRYYDEASDTFDFSNSFQDISSYLDDSSFVVGDLECVFAGADENYEGYDRYGVAGGLYNAPESAASDLKAAGFSLFQTANSHSADFGKEGIDSTIDFLTNAGLQNVGTQKAENDPRYTVASVNGINVGFVSYTNSMNGYLEEADSYAVNTLDGYDEEKISQACDDVGTASQNADLVVVLVQCGDSYATEPDTSQTELFDAFFNAGADIVIGNGSYSLMPVEVKDIQDENGTSRKGLAIYSLGTFLGSQVYSESLGIDNDVSAIFDVVIQDDGSGPQITGFRLTPTYLYYTSDDLFILPVGEVHDNWDTYASFVDETEKTRIDSIFENTVNTLLEGTGLTAQYENQRFQVNF